MGWIAEIIVLQLPGYMIEGWLFAYMYSLFTLRKHRPPLILDGNLGFLGVSTEQTIH